MSNRRIGPKTDVFGCPACGRELLELSYMQSLPPNPRGSRIHPDLKCPGCGRRYQSADLALGTRPARREG